MNNSSIITLPSKTFSNILELIKMMTGLKNFNEIYVKYIQILNNLEDISYEFPRQSDVEHCVKGLLEKYRIQGFPLEAKEFEMRVYQFINYSNIDNQSKLSSDIIKWAIIGMIINMANNPCGFRNVFRKTNLDIVKSELEGEIAVHGDSWKTTLIQELLDIGKTVNNNESDYETDYEDETDLCSLNVESLQKITVNDVKVKDNPLTKREYLKLVFANEDSARNLLLKRASKFWWLHKSKTLDNGGSKSSHFALLKYYKNKKFKIIDDKFVILECLKSYETLSDICQYKLKDQSQLFSYKTTVPYVSPEVFNKWTLTISIFIKQFNNLINFVNNLNSLNKIPYTLRAYGKGLEQILMPIVQKIGCIKNRITNTVEHETILSFEQEMYMHFHIVCYIYTLHTKALISNWETTDNWKIAIKLISVLFCSIQTAVVDYQKSIVMTLFLYTFETYVHMTELWINGGLLVDEYNEFIISGYEGDNNTVFNIFFKNVCEYLESLNLNIPPILEYLLHILNNCDWKVFVASQVNNDGNGLFEVPRGELFHDFLTKTKISNYAWAKYITPFNEYNSSNWYQLPMLASCCINYKYTDQSTFKLTIPSSYEMADIFFIVIQKAMNNIGLKIRNIMLKENKFVYHLKKLYNIIFLEEVNKNVSIDRLMEYKIERNSFLNNCFYSLLSDDHSSVLSSNNSCNLSLHYKTDKYNVLSENNAFGNNFVDELECITIAYDVKFPLNLLLTNDIIHKYNKIFHLLITAKQAAEIVSQLQTKDLNKYNYSLDVKRMYFIRLWIMSTTYKLQTYFFSVASKYLGSKLFESIEKVKNGMEAFEKVLEDHVSQAIKLCMLDGLMEKLSYESLALLWNACEQFAKLWMKSVSDDSIDIELMEKIEQDYVDSCWKLASSLDTYIVAEDDTSSILFEFCRDFMSSMPTKESADLDGSLIYKLSNSQNRYSFTYT